MNAGYAELKTADRVVARFLSEYHRNWQDQFPGLNKRAHWHVIFSARLAGREGVSCRAIHRALYGSYGTDIRTCIERIHDCERDGFVTVFDDRGRPCPASAGCLIGATDKLRESFDRHCRATIDEMRAVFGADGRRLGPAIRCDHETISAIFQFFGAYDQKWRETADAVVRQKHLTPAYHNDAMDHLVTYQYWAIAMLLWSASTFANGGNGTPALVVDEINSKMWDALRLGHLAIRERVGNLIRWGFFSEQTIKKHKAVAMTDLAGAGIGKGLAETLPLLEQLYAKIAASPAATASARTVQR
jgi:hypothetical protein